MARPKTPSSFIRSMSRSGYSFACSSSRAAGRTSSSTKRRTVSRTSSSSGESVGVVHTEQRQLRLAEIAAEVRVGHVERTEAPLLLSHLHQLEQHLEQRVAT